MANCVRCNYPLSEQDISYSGSEFAPCFGCVKQAAIQKKCSDCGGDFDPTELKVLKERFGDAYKIPRQCRPCRARRRQGTYCGPAAANRWKEGFVEEQFEIGADALASGKCRDCGGEIHANDRARCVEWFGSAPIRCLLCRRKLRQMRGQPEKPPQTGRPPDPAAPDVPFNDALRASLSWEDAERRKV